MNTIEHLLSVLAEEGCEIAQNCSKALRFGIDDVYTHIDLITGEHTTYPEKTNRQGLVEELNDLLAVCYMLEKEGILPTNWKSADMQLKKIEKVARYIRYSESVGAICQNKS